MAHEVPSSNLTVENNSTEIGELLDHLDKKFTRLKAREGKATVGKVPV